MVGLSAITGSVGRLVATAQNGLEVLRYGGLETGAVPSPFQIIQSVPMYRLRRYFPPDARPGAKRPGPPVLMVHPMMMSADMWDVTRDAGAVGILHMAGIDPWVIDFGSPDKVEGGMDRNLADHVVALSEAIDTVKEVTGRDVHLAGYSQGGMFAYQSRGLPPVEGSCQHRRVRCARRHPGRVADEPACQPGAGGRGLHGRPRVQPHRHPRLAGAYWFPDARPHQDGAVAAGLPAPAA